MQCKKLKVPGEIQRKENLTHNLPLLLAQDSEFLGRGDKQDEGVVVRSV